MAVVKLRLRRYQSANIGGIDFHLDRIQALIRIHGHILREAVIDTGAPVTVFPEVEWRRFESGIRWLTTEDDQGAPSWCRRFAGVAGGLIKCRLGVVNIEFLSIKNDRIGPEQIGPKPIAGMFALDKGQMNEILIGLSGGSLAGSKLEVDMDVAKALLRES